METVIWTACCLMLGVASAIESTSFDRLDLRQRNMAAKDCSLCSLCQGFYAAQKHNSHLPRCTVIVGLCPGCSSGHQHESYLGTKKHQSRLDFKFVFAAAVLVDGTCLKSSELGVKTVDLLLHEILSEKDTWHCFFKPYFRYSVVVVSQFTQLSHAASKYRGTSKAVLITCSLK